MGPIAPIIEGVSRLTLDIESIFSDEEQDLLHRSDAGRNLGKVVSHCQSEKQQRLEKIKGIESVDDDYQRRQLTADMDSFYADCIGNDLCPERWTAYESCWQSYVNEIKYRKVEGPIVLIDHCRLKRISLEQCIGRRVSQVIEASDQSILHFGNL